MHFTFYQLFFCDIDFNWSAVTPIVAIIVSIFVLFVNRGFSQKNIRLSIQQAIFKTVTEKAKDCNSMWEAEPEDEKNDTSPHFKIISEMIISKEIIEKSFVLFGKNYKSISDYKDDYYYLFWKQLRTDLRGFVRRSPEIAKRLNDPIYTKQINDIYFFLKKHFE